MRTVANLQHTAMNLDSGIYLGLHFAKFVHFIHFSYTSKGPGPPKGGGPGGCHKGQKKGQTKAKGPA